MPSGSAPNAAGAMVETRMLTRDSPPGRVGFSLPVGVSRLLASGAGPGSCRVDLPLGVAADELPLELFGTDVVFAQRVRRTVQERLVPGAVHVLQLADQVGFGEVLGIHTGHRSSLWWVSSRIPVGLARRNH